MARTKQTARKSAGGASVRKATSANQLRAHMTSQQASGKKGVAKASYLNDSNVFYRFGFADGGASKITSPLEVRCFAAPVEPSSSWLAVFLHSVLDNVGADLPLDLVVVLDKSGSMGCTLSGDGESAGSQPSRLDVAKMCLLKIVDQLRAQDRFSLIGRCAGSREWCAHHACSQV
jgi:hypothetical protein